MPSDPDMDLPYAGSRGTLTSSVSFWLFSSKEKTHFQYYFIFVGKQTAIIISSVIGSLVLFGLLFCLTFFLCRKKKGRHIDFNFIVRLIFVAFYFSFNKVSLVIHVIVWRLYLFLYLFCCRSTTNSMYPILIL
jgi:hypothetical protein